MNQHLKYLLFSVLSGLLFVFSWPEIGNLEWLIFLAFIPLLHVERLISENEEKRRSGKVFFYAYISFLIFNYGTTWWIRLASFEGMIMAEVFNSLFMATIFLFLHLTRRFINDKVGYGSLIFYWMAFEYLHTNWELSWIWLNLGNVFANRITWIQWYEYTGTFGGSFWILSVNALVFYYWTQWKNAVSRRIQITRITLLVAFIVLPFLLSIIVFRNYKEELDPVEVVLVQPNIDPYNDKFGGMTEKEQIQRLVKLSAREVTNETSLIFGPETAFPSGYWEEDLDHTFGVLKVQQLLEEYPNVKYIVGLSSIRHYRKGDELSPTARPMQDGSGDHYDYYNSVMQIENDQPHQIYRKSKLVLGVEKMPFIAQFDFMKKLSINLGGASGSLGSEKEPKIFHSTTQDGREINVIPAICYESIYGEFLTEFAKKGGNLVGRGHERWLVGQYTWV